MAPITFSGKPRQCPDCNCVQWHVLEGKINTASERYVCMNDCGCVRWADKIDPGPQATSGSITRGFSYDHQHPSLSGQPVHCRD